MLLKDSTPGHEYLRITWEHSSQVLIEALEFAPTWSLVSLQHSCLSLLQRLAADIGLPAHLRPAEGLFWPPYGQEGLFDSRVQTLQAVTGA